MGLRPPLESPVVVSSTSFRLIHSLTMVETVALFSPVSSEILAREMCFLFSICLIMVSRLADRISLVCEIFMKKDPHSAYVQNGLSALT